MPRKTIRTHILEYLASELRVIAADWRIHIAYVRIARRHGYGLPDSTHANSVVSKLLANGQLENIRDVRGVYRVVVPYASSLPSPDEVIIQEANPTAVFGHLTAFAYHALTNEIPNTIYLYHTQKNTRRTPLGTMPDDWIDVPQAIRRKPPSIGNRSVIWTQTKPEWDFGDMIGYAHGLPIYITDLEKTLVDSLRFPEKCGGLARIFTGWGKAADVMDLDRLIEYVERIGQSLLRQRTGFVLERLVKSHSRLDEWASRSVRGSSAKLAANKTFSSTYSERWNLSINVPESLLALLKS